MQVIKSVLKLLYGNTQAMFTILRDTTRLCLWRLLGKIAATTTVKTKQGRLTVFTRDREIGKSIFRWREFELNESFRVHQFWLCAK